LRVRAIVRSSHASHVVESKKSPTYSWAKSIGIGATPLEEVLSIDSKWLSAQDRRALINHLGIVFNTARIAGRLGNVID
jgi:hypothetical protein